MMSIFSSISWADFLIAAITLLLLFNIAVVVYYQAFYKGDKPNNPIDNKFANSESSEELNEDDEEEDNDMMFVSYNEEEEETNEDPIIPNEVQEAGDDSSSSQEELLEVEIDQETEDAYNDISEGVFFTDGEVLSEDMADDVEEAFAMLGFTTSEKEEEEEDEPAEVYPSDDELMEASVRSFNIQSVELDEEDNLFLQIKEQLSEIQEKEDEEALKQNSNNRVVDDNFFGSSPM
jgi:hypothetical protein